MEKKNPNKRKNSDNSLGNNLEKKCKLTDTSSITQVS